jgi:hypothetical protein
MIRIRTDPQPLLVSEATTIATRNADRSLQVLEAFSLAGAGPGRVCESKARSCFAELKWGSLSAQTVNLKVTLHLLSIVKTAEGITSCRISQAPAERGITHQL